MLRVETTECTMADVENAEMIEADENDKIDPVDLDVDQGDCVSYDGWWPFVVHSWEINEIFFLCL